MARYFKSPIAGARIPRWPRPPESLEDRRHGLDRMIGNWGPKAILRSTPWGDLNPSNEKRERRRWKAGRRAAIHRNTQWDGWQRISHPCLKFAGRSYPSYDYHRLAAPRWRRDLQPDNAPDGPMSFEPSAQRLRSTLHARLAKAQMVRTIVRNRYYASAILELRTLVRLCSGANAELGTLPPHHAHVFVLRVSRLLRSKRIPAEVRRHPLVADVVAYARSFDDENDHVWKCVAFLSDPDRSALDTIKDMQSAVMDDFFRHFARPLARHLATLEDPMPHEAAGVLSSESRGPTTIMTAAVPADREAEFRAFVAGLHAERLPPTLSDVQAVVAQHEWDFRKMRVERIWVYGSVAAGTATGASDIDLLYRTRDGTDAYRCWNELRRLFEQETGRLVDIFPITNEDAAMEKKPATLVWTTEKG